MHLVVVAVTPVFAAIVALSVLSAPVVLILLLYPALQCADGKRYRPDFVVAALVAGVADVVTAHTTWPFVAGWPQKGEWTVSHTLERLCVTPSDDQALFVEMGKAINRVSPTRRHIKAVCSSPN